MNPSLITESIALCTTQCRDSRVITREDANGIHGRTPENKLLTLCSYPNSITGEMEKQRDSILPFRAVSPIACLLAVFGDIFSIRTDDHKSIHFRLIPSTYKQYARRTFQLWIRNAA